MHKIENFWDWFVQNVQLTERVILDHSLYEKEQIIQGFDEHILGMGPLKWLLDNPEPGKFTFTLSPNNNPELLTLTRQIMANAPHLAGWTFYEAIPAQNKYKISLYDSEMNLCEVDSSGWLVAAMPFGGQTWQLKIQASNIAGLDEDTRQVAVDLMLTSLLGEAKKIQKIGQVKLVDRIDETLETDYFSIRELTSLVS